MKTGITVCGNLFVDSVKIVNTFPKEGMLANITGQRRGVGGCVSNTSICLARLAPELPVSAAGFIGQDEAGDYLRGRLHQEGIDTAWVKNIPGWSTGFTDVISSEKTKTRTFFNCRGANSVYGFDDIPFAEINTRRFHMGYALLLDQFDKADPEHGTVMARALSAVQQKGIRTSIDVVSEDGDRFRQVVEPSLKYCDDVIINEIEGGRIAGIDSRDAQGSLKKESLSEICAALLKKGVANSVIIHCPEYGCMMTNNGDFVCLSSLSLPSGYIKGTVGAGDAFCAGALLGLYYGFPPKETLKLAICTAGANLASEDSVSGILNLEQVKNLEKYFKE